MPFLLKRPEKDIKDATSFKNESGCAECVELVKQAADAPATYRWKRGLWVKGSRPGQIQRGTAIATFDENGKYPTDNRGKHAAIYLWHDNYAIYVLDQWAGRAKVGQRPIWFNRSASTPRANSGDYFYVIE